MRDFDETYWDTEYNNKAELREWITLCGLMFEVPKDYNDVSGIDIYRHTHTHTPSCSMTFTQNRLVRYFWFTLMELCLDETPSFIFIYLFIFNCCIECCASFITKLLIKCSLLESCSADKGQVYLKVNENTELDWIFFSAGYFFLTSEETHLFPHRIESLCVI